MRNSRVFARRMAALAFAVLIVTASHAGTTQAAWTDAEQGRTASVTAGVLTTPNSSTCVPRSVAVLGLQDVTLTWSSSQQGAQRVQITRGVTTGTDIQGAAGSKITQTGSAGGTFQYQAVFTSNNLLGLLNLTDLLGGTYTIRVYNGLAGTTWLSAPLTYSLNVVLLGLGSSCTIA